MVRMIEQSESLQVNYCCSHSLQFSLERSLQERLKESDITKETNSRLNFTIQMLNEQISELKAVVELRNHEHNDYLTAMIELQMLREEVRVYRENGDIVRDLQAENHKMQKTIQDLRKLLTETERKSRELSMQGTDRTRCRVAQELIHYGRSVQNRCISCRITQ